MASLDLLLENTSRTFALSIPMLPEPTRGRVGVAYLLFRIADTFEDAARWDRGRRVAALNDLADLLDGAGSAEAAAARWVAGAPVDHPGYLELLSEAPRVLDAYFAIPDPAREVVRRDLKRTVDGMAGFVHRGEADGSLRLATLRDLRDYCYTVAGIVGEMLTELFLIDDPGLGAVAARLRRRSRFFGEGLQLVNILKDAAADAGEGRVYLPAGIERAEIFALARGDLDRAAEYVGALQGARAPEGFVAFTGSPAILARASLDRLESEGPGAKISRVEVAALMETMFENLAAGRPLLTARARRDPVLEPGSRRSKAR